MSSHRFLQIIDQSFIGKVVAAKTRIAEELDPQMIYVENIRRFFNLPQSIAKYFCEMAVKQHIFRKKVGVYCPDCGRMVEEIEYGSTPPARIHCDVCEVMENSKYEFNEAEYQTMEFYQLIK